jgi:hypothetical protein
MRHPGHIRSVTAVLLALSACCAVPCASAAALEGYCWPLSAAPDDTVTFMVSSTADYQVTFMRYHRQNDGNVGTALATLTNLPAGVQAAPDSGWKGCSWAPSFQFVVPADWTSGIYGAELSSPGLTTFRMSFVVKPRPEAHGDFAVLANTNTWNAYNDWGGRSKYTSTPGHDLGFLRPNPYIHATGAGTNHLTRAELWVLDWLASSGYRVDVYSDLDLRNGIPGLDLYKGLILHTHPEYWSVEMLDQLESYLVHGGSILYIGGNGIYEKVVFSPDGKQLTFFPVYWNGTREARRYSYYRNLDPPRPERAVLGVAYRSDGYQTWASFQVLDAAHRFFTGTGVWNGSLIGASGLNGGGASGWEMDTSIPGLAPDGVIVSAYGSDDRGSPPENIELLARGTNAGGYGADMTYYRHPGGGGVFSAGSLSFGGSLVIDPVLQQIIRNVLDEFLNTVSGVAPGIPGGSKTLAIEPNRPNPFARSTTIRFKLAHPDRVSLRVFDVTGRHVRTLVDDLRPVQAMETSWDGRDDAGRSVNAGIYLLRLQTSDLDESRRMLRLR